MSTTDGNSIPTSYKPYMEGYYNYYEEIHRIGAIQDQGYIMAIKIEGIKFLS